MFWIDTPLSDDVFFMAMAGALILIPLRPAVNSVLSWICDDVLFRV